MDIKKRCMDYHFNLLQLWPKIFLKNVLEMFSCCQSALLYLLMKEYHGGFSQKRKIGFVLFHNVRLTSLLEDVGDPFHYFDPFSPLWPIFTILTQFHHFHPCSPFGPIFKIVQVWTFKTIFWQKTTYYQPVKGHKSIFSPTVDEIQ